MAPFSQRLSWLTPPNPLSQLQAARQARGINTLDLTHSNPTIAFNGYPHEEIGAALARTCDFSYHPEPFGLPSARACVADYYGRRGLFISPDHLLLTASTSEAYTFLFFLLCNPGDQIVIPAPSYPLFEYLSRLCSVELVQYRLHYDGAWHIDFAHLANVITSRTRAAIIVSPNNPAGNYLRADQAHRLFSLLADRKLALIIDEVFCDYQWISSLEPISLAGNRECLTFSLNGLSKSCGMPQMKLAWTAISGPDEIVADTCRRLELITDAYLSVNIPVQLALSELLRIGADIREQVRLRVTHNLRILDRMVEGSPITRLHAEGGWSAILRLPLLSRGDYAYMLLDQWNVLVQPGYFFDLDSEALVVVSLLTPPQTFLAGLEHICRFALTLS